MSSMLVLKLAFTEEILLNSKKFISYLIAYL
jgi:long-chain acyl-CoA synthetase